MEFICQAELFQSAYAEQSRVELVLDAADASPVPRLLGETLLERRDQFHRQGRKHLPRMRCRWRERLEVWIQPRQKPSDSPLAKQHAALKKHWLTSGTAR